MCNGVAHRCRWTTCRLRIMTPPTRTMHWAPCQQAWEMLHRAQQVIHREIALGVFTTHYQINSYDMAVEFMHKSDMAYDDDETISSYLLIKTSPMRILPINEDPLAARRP
jgi:hypothetical protein